MAGGALEPPTGKPRHSTSSAIFVYVSESFKWCAPPQNVEEVSAEENGEQLYEEEPQNQYTQQEEQEDLYQTPNETAAAAGGESRSEARKRRVLAVVLLLLPRQKTSVLLLFITSGSETTGRTFTCAFVTSCVTNDLLSSTSYHKRRPPE